MSMNINQQTSQISLNLLHAVDVINELNRIQDMQSKKIQQLENVNSELIKDNDELHKRVTFLEGDEAQKRG